MEGANYDDERKVLRKAVSDVLYEMDKYYKYKIEKNGNMSMIEEVVKEAECQCCGMKEECTQAYISEVEECYCGEWVCGLCSAALKETLARHPHLSMQDALNSHRTFCYNYNTTTRLNPKLSLTLSMRDIAKRSLHKRSKLARTTSYP